MFKNKATNDRNNICGNNVARLRKSQGLSQRMLAEKMQMTGIDIDKNAIQRIECGKRFVTDIELIALSKTLGCSLEILLAPYSITEI